MVAGLSVITASTVIMLRGLEARDRLDSPEGRIAIGWSVAEDILTVFALVILPVVAPVITKAPGGIIGDRFWPALLVSLAKIVAFVTLMVFVGRRFVPWLLEQVARLGSRELFTLAVLDRAGISRAKLLVVTAPEPIRARRIVEVAREAQAALGLAHYALQSIGQSDDQADVVVDAIRQQRLRPGRRRC